MVISLGHVFDIAEDELAEERGSFQRMLAAWFETDTVGLEADPSLRGSAEGEESLELRLGSI